MFEFVTAFWDSLGHEGRGYSIQIILAVVGVLVVFLQIGRQARNAIKANVEAEKLKLKLRIFEEISDAISSGIESEVEFSGFIRRFLSDLEIYRSLRDSGLPYRLPTARVEKYLELHDKLSEADSTILRLIERWEVVDVRSDIFRLALASAMFDIRKAHGDYFFRCVKLYPRNDGDEDARHLSSWSYPKPKDLSELNTMSEALTKAVDELGCYYIDISNEMKNLLLGDLFGSKNNYREPIDPRLHVIRLDRYEELKAYFENESPMALERKESERRAWAQLREQ